MRGILLKLTNPHLRALVECFLMDAEFLRDFCRAPAGIKNHHAYLGGLLEHVVTLLDGEYCIILAPNGQRQYFRGPAVVFPEPMEQFVKRDGNQVFKAHSLKKNVGLHVRVVKDVTNGPSPDWLKRRLRAIGLRPINALVDITNYIAYDRGRPLPAWSNG